MQFVVVTKMTKFFEYKMVEIAKLKLVTSDIATFLTTMTNSPQETKCVGYNLTTLIDEYKPVEQGACF